MTNQWTSHSKSCVIIKNYTSAQFEKDAEYHDMSVYEKEVIHIHQSDVQTTVSYMHKKCFNNTVSLGSRTIEKDVALQMDADQ